MTDRFITFDDRDRSRQTGIHPFLEQTRDFLDGQTYEGNVIRVKEARLDIGDVSWVGYNGQLNLIEIKKASDAMASMTDGRVQDQVAGLIGEKQNVGANVRIWVVGRIASDDLGRCQFNDDVLDVGMTTASAISVLNNMQRLDETEHRGWKNAAIHYSRWISYIESLQEMGITVRENMPPQDFSRYLSATVKRSLKSRHHNPARRVVKIVDGRAQALLCLSPALTLPGAQNLLEEFGTVRQVLRQPPKNLVQVRQIGNKTAQELYTAGNAEDKL